MWCPFGMLQSGTVCIWGAFEGVQCNWCPFGVVQSGTVPTWSEFEQLRRKRCPFEGGTVQTVPLWGELAAVGSLLFGIPHSFAPFFPLLPLFQPLELLCEKSIGTANRPMGAGEALRRVLECLASGIVMPG